MRHLIFLVLSFWLGAVTSLSQTANEPIDHRRQRNSVDVQYRFQESRVSLHEPVVLIFSVYNGLAEPIKLRLGADKTQFFKFALRTPDGRTLENSPNPGENVTIVTFGPEELTVESGSDYQQPILMNKWFRFVTTGSYGLTVRLTIGAESSEGKSLPLPDGTAQLQVGPRDPERLEKVCAELERTVEDTLSVGEWQLPARMLSSVDDPIAVPYLQRLLFLNKGAQNIVIPALQRIGGDDSVAVLLSALDNKFGDTAELARQALSQMKNRISNPSLKQAVERALAPRAAVKGKGMWPVLQLREILSAKETC
jgi:hypothetical protein